MADATGLPPTGLPPNGGPIAGPAAVSDTVSGADLCRSYARCFGSADGSRVLADLERSTLGRVLGPAADEATLRHLEGQRAVVARIRALVARGRTG